MPEFSADFDLVAAAPDQFLEQCRGGNQQLVFIGFEAEDGAADRLLFLKKIMAALQLDLDRDTLFAGLRPGEAASFFQLLKKKGVEKMIVFGLPSGQFGLAFEARLYEPVGFYGCKFLFAEGLAVIESDQAKKAKLWAALKAMF